MRGLCFHGPDDVRYAEDLSDPEIEQPHDVVIEVRAAGLCGSDLHPYEGREPAAGGVVPGHEAVGVVVATGDDVRTVRVGARVLVPFTTSCGRCRACTAGLSSRCATGQLLGWAPPGAAHGHFLHGAQAERLRVPQADGTLVTVPPGISDAEAVLLTDNLPTAWYAAERADIPAGATVAVVGLGAVGLCAVVAARAAGAAAVIGIDPVAGRRARAQTLGAQVCPPGQTVEVQGFAGTAIAAAIDAAGTPAGQALAADLVEPGGTLSIIAVQTAPTFAFSPSRAYDANLTIRAGRAPVRSVLERLLPMVTSGLVTVPAEVVVTHPQASLRDGPALYRRFAEREADLVKVVFTP